MKRIKIIPAILLIILATNAFAQTNELAIMQNSRIIGKTIKDNQAIEAKVFMFPERVHEIKIDQKKKLALIHLREKRKKEGFKNRGTVLTFGLEQEKILWNKPISFTNENYSYYNHLLIQSKGNRYFSLNKFDGGVNWELFRVLVMMDASKNFALTYRFGSSISLRKHIEGINLTSGEKLWKREISPDFRWNEHLFLNDTTILLAASGLHTININTGLGWDYDAITGELSYAKIAGDITVAGLAFGMMTGIYVYAYGTDLLRDVCSNIFMEDNAIYFASKGEFVKLDIKGNSIWKHQTAAYNSSKSKLFSIGNNIYLLNFGYALYGDEKVNYGNPFITAYDKNTGRQLFINTLADNEKEFIKTHQQIGNKMLMLFDNKITLFDLEAQKIENKKTYNTIKTGIFQHFYGDKTWVKEGDKYLRMKELDQSKTYIHTKNEYILILNPDLSFAGEIKKKDALIEIHKTDKHAFLYNNDRILIINSEGHCVSEFEGTTDAVYFDQKLYDRNDNEFRIIDLNFLK